MIDHEEHRWNDFKRGLAPEHQRAFDAVFQRARRHASAAGNQGAIDPFDAVLLTVLVELESELQRLLARVAWLEADADQVPVGLAPRGRHPLEEPMTRYSHPEEDRVEPPDELEEQETV